MILLERLRAQTTEFHERLHVHPALEQLSHETVSRPYLTKALTKFYGFYTPLERRYALTDNSLKTDFPAGAVVRHLQNDLQKAGVQTSELAIMDQPNEPFTLEEVVGYLYLREGSNLGGKVISKNLAQALNLEPGIDNQFFWGHGLETGQNWKLFLKKIEELEPQLDLDATSTYAANLFKKLDAWLHGKEKENA